MDKWTGGQSRSGCGGSWSWDAVAATGGEDSTPWTDGVVQIGLSSSNLAFRIGMAICGSMVLISSSGMVSRVLSTDRSQTTSTRNHLPLLFLDATELRDHAGVVGTDEARDWSFTMVLESKGDEGICMILHLCGCRASLGPATLGMAVLFGGAGAGLGCSGPPPGQLASLRLIPG